MCASCQVSYSCVHSKESLGRGKEILNPLLGKQAVSYISRICMYSTFLGAARVEVLLV